MENHDRPLISVCAPKDGAVYTPVKTPDLLLDRWTDMDSIIAGARGDEKYLYFGQGPWTPFQMFAWGLLGFLAGVLAKPLKRRKVWMILYGLLAGVLFSAIMDVWTTLWADGTFNLSRYLAAIISAIPFTVEYAVSNVVFLLLLAKPIGEKLERIKRKYGLFQTSLST